ncbi:hypothetical protein [Desulfobotulus mexicanus]|nr:hypothetical protein [Desulfobotulus mexicanus]
MIKTVLLDKSLHNRNRFDCGIDPLNNYLKNIAEKELCPVSYQFTIHMA